ncbi:MAG: carboxypeptidase-like regulatory domain-containing protein [Cytophagaceae bacterium]|nr:carboxypeptidase-like regulatory domain-containing protein [Cytophagaceae bacterium]MDW8457001.1 carboxypeptidase-like regulatory domain-containing protein [Cytophagaceae bacterium]
MRTFIIFSISLISFCIHSQTPRGIVQVSGLVVRGDSMYGIPNAVIYDVRSGRGTTTNHVGYFSLPVLKGDTLRVNTYGYKPKTFKVPDALSGDQYSIIIELAEDTLILPDVVIFPWPTEQLFKEAFLALKLPENEINNMDKNLNEQITKRMLYTMHADGSENHRYYMQKVMQANDMRYQVVSPALVFLNPFSWARFIKDVKEKKFKSNFKEQDTYYNEE